MNYLLRASASLALGVISLTTPASKAAEIPLNAIGQQPEGVTTEITERKDGPYVAAWLGAATAGQASFRDELRGAELGDSTGFAGGIKLGYSWQTPFFLRPSVELELAYLSDELSPTGSVNGDRGSGRIKDGGTDLNAVVGTVNFVLALDLGVIRDQVGDFVAGLHPYVGVGVGGAYSTMDKFETRVDGSSKNDDKIRVDGGSKIDFAYQFLAGLEIDLDDSVSIFGEYKHISLNSTGSDSIRDYERDLWVVGCKLAY